MLDVVLRDDKEGGAVNLAHGVGKRCVTQNVNSAEMTRDDCRLSAYTLVETDDLEAVLDARLLPSYRRRGCHGPRQRRSARIRNETSIAAGKPSSP